MKRFFCLFAVLILCLSGCARRPRAETGASSPETSAATETSVRDTTVPETSAKETSASESAAKETSASETSAKDTAAPETSAGESRTEEDLYTGEPEPAFIGDKTVGENEIWHLADNCAVGRLEIAETAVIEADFPVLCFFQSSQTVQNGDVSGNVTFINDYDEIIAIVHTNDTHGFLSAEPYVKGLKDQLAASGRYSAVLAVNAGDVYSGGNAVAHIYNGEFIPYIMSPIYDVMVWGNNDIALSNSALDTYFLSMLGRESGLVTLASNLDAAEDIDMEKYALAYAPATGAETFASLYPDVLSPGAGGSIDYTKIDLASYSLKAGENALPDHMIFETENGSKIGLFGCASTYFNGSAFVTPAATLDNAAAEAQALKAEGAGCVVMVTHSGWTGDNEETVAASDVNSAVLARNGAGIDVIIDAHTHSVINEGEGVLLPDAEGVTLVNQADCKGRAIGVIYLYLKDGAFVGADMENLTAGPDGTFDRIMPDADTEARVRKAWDKLEADGYNEVWGHTDVFLNGERLTAKNEGGSIRANETNMGDLAADAVLWFSNARISEGTVSAALLPGFFLRCSIEPGDITLADAVGLFYAGAFLGVFDVTAAEIVEAIEGKLPEAGKENAYFSQVSGLRAVIGPDRKLRSLSIAGESVMEDGRITVSEDRTFTCVSVLIGERSVIFSGAVPREIISDSNAETARLFCEFLRNGTYVICPNTVSPDGRMVFE